MRVARHTTTTTTTEMIVDDGAFNAFNAFNDLNDLNDDDDDAFNDASTMDHRDDRDRHQRERYWLRKHVVDRRRHSDASSNASAATGMGARSPSAEASVSPAGTFAFAFATPSSRRATPGEARRGGRTNDGGAQTPATPMAFSGAYRSPTEEETARLERLLEAPLKPNGGRRARSSASLATPQQTPLKLRFENFADEGRSAKRARKMSDVFKATKSTSTPRVTRARKKVVRSL